MRKRWCVRRGVGALLALAVCGATARADMSVSDLPHWKAFLAPDEGHVFVLSNDHQVGIESHFFPEVTTSGAGSVHLALLPFTKYGVGEPHSSGPFTFDAGTSPFGFSVHLTDLPSHRHAIIDFTGYFSGSMTATTAGIAAVFTSPDTRMVTLGNFTYVLHATYEPVGPPVPWTTDHSAVGRGSPAPTDPSAGAFTVVIDGVSTPAPGPVPTPDTPEPSSLVLAVVGLPLAGLACWCGLRRKK
jgi:hypothetical protein